MRSVSIVIIFLLLVPFSYGQLTVKPSSHKDSFLYVNGTVLFVKQDVNLMKNADASPTEASIYLRNEGQLIQGHGGRAINSGNGLLSVFQEGTSNAYDYNYWSSPVSDGTLGNGNFGIQMFHAPLTRTQSQRAGHTSALDGRASPLSISSRWIFTYSGSTYSDWNPISESTAIPAGYGFTMKGVGGVDHTTVDGVMNNAGNAQRYDFRGKPNNGPIAIPLVSGEFTLVGNPFPSALDLSLFLLENSGTGTFVTTCGGSISRSSVSTGIAYFWDSVENGNSHYLQDYIGGYGAFSPVDPCTEGIYERPIFKSYGPSGTGETGLTGNHYARRFLPIGQGFMVQSFQNGDLTFENRHRSFRKEGDLSQFKEAETTTGVKMPVRIPKIRLEAVINEKYKRHLTLAFWPTATSRTDPGMDAAAYDSAPTDIGVLQNDKNFVIDVRPYNESEEIPLFLKVEDLQASVALRISEVENLEVSEVYIFDILYNIYFPLSKASYRIKLEKGNYNHRFKIVFKDKSKVPKQEEVSSGNLEISQNLELKRIEIQNPNGIPLESVAVFDLLGRLVHFTRNVQSENIYIPSSNYASSYYIVRVMTTSLGTITKQISIFNHL